MLVAVDFDGTIVEHKYPEIGKEKPFAIEVLKKLSDEGVKVVLWTIREGKYLDEAIEFCRSRGLEFYAVNNELPNNSLFAKAPSSRKIRADFYIDDRNIGGLPDWGEIYELISQKRFEKSRKRRLRHIFKS